MTPSPVSCGLSTSLTLSCQTVSKTQTRRKRIKEAFFLPLFFKNLHFIVGAHNTPSLWAGTNGGCVFAYMLRLPNVEHRADEPVAAQQGERKSRPVTVVFPPRLVKL